MIQLEQIAKRFSTRCLAFFVKDLPVELKPWGEAMLAEMPEVQGIFAPVSWAMGGSMTLSKALVRRWFSGKAVRSSSAPGGGANSPSPWQRAALLMLLLSLAMGLSPNFRQALATSVESWNPTWSPLRGEQLDRLVERAEKLNDPASQAFVALNTPDLGKAERLAEQAARQDPSLQWVWFPVIQRQLIAVKPAMDLRSPAVAQRIEQLKAWDPENAAPYLLEAEWIRRNKVGIRVNSPREREELRRDPAWLSAMERAFAAPRYDIYFNRRMQLDGRLLRNLKAVPPLAMVQGVRWFAVPAWASILDFSKLLLAEGDRALGAGDQEQAEARYWQAAHFAERMRAQASNFFFYSSSLQRDSYQKLSALMARQHRDAEKARLDQTLASLEKERDRLHSARGFWELIYGPVSSAGIAVSLSSAIAFLALALSLAGMGYFFLRRWLRFPAPRLLDSVLATAGRLAPFALAASCVCLYFSYLPYARFYAGYLNGTLPPEAGGQLESFMQIRYFPNRVISLLGGQIGLSFWFWGSMTVLLTLVVIGFVLRWTRHRRGTLQAG